MTVPRYWREIPQRYNLQASTCGVCEAVHYPPRTICPTCRRASIGKMERKPLSGEATLMEWTIVHKAAPGYEDYVPYIMGLVQSKEGPILTAQIVDVEIDQLRDNMPLRSTFRRIGADGADGVIHYGTKWRPA
jgi:uncharacterized OB-fold protein